MRLEQNDIEANCVLDHIVGSNELLPASCNARILEEELRSIGYDNVAGIYDCTFTVETPDSMYGEYFVTIEAEDLDGLYSYADEVEYWFLNPVIALSIDGELAFEDVRPGTSAYSETLLVGNDADEGSGVLLDMQISGTDFYDPASSGAKCPVTNRLKLNNGGTAPVYDNEGFTANPAASSSRRRNREQPRREQATSLHDDRSESGATSRRSSRRWTSTAPATRRDCRT